MVGTVQFVCCSGSSVSTNGFIFLSYLWSYNLGSTIKLLPIIELLMKQEAFVGVELTIEATCITVLEL